MKQRTKTILFAIILLLIFTSGLIYTSGLIRKNEILEFDNKIMKHENKAMRIELETIRYDFDSIYWRWQEAEENKLPKFELTPEERELIERVVAAEARGEGLKGQIAVANVIKDRADLWGMTPTEVVTARGQFAEPFKGEISEDTKLAVSIVFDYGIRVFQDNVTHFASNNPLWAESKAIVGKIGGHVFYY